MSKKPSRRCKFLGLAVWLVVGGIALAACTDSVSTGPSESTAEVSVEPTEEPTEVHHPPTFSTTGEPIPTEATGTTAAASEVRAEPVIHDIADWPKLGLGINRPGEDVNEIIGAGEYRVFKAFLNADWNGLADLIWNDNKALYGQLGSLKLGEYSIYMAQIPYDGSEHSYYASPVLDAEVLSSGIDTIPTGRCRFTVQSSQGSYWLVPYPPKKDDLPTEDMRKRIIDILTFHEWYPSVCFRMYDYDALDGADLDEYNLSLFKCVYSYTSWLHGTVFLTREEIAAAFLEYFGITQMRRFEQMTDALCSVDDKYFPGAAGGSTIAHRIVDADDTTPGTSVVRVQFFADPGGLIKSDLYEYHIAMGDNTFQFQGAVVLEKGAFKPYLAGHGLASHLY